MSRTVVVDNFSFSPIETRVAVGGTVTWDFRETNHTVVINGQTLRPTGPTSMMFSMAGRYAYNCGPHGSSMPGVIIVE